MGYKITSKHLNDILNNPLLIENILNLSRNLKKELTFSVEHSFKTKDYAISKAIPEDSEEKQWGNNLRLLPKPSYGLLDFFSHDSGKINLSYEDIKNLHETRQVVKSEEGILYNPLIGIVGTKKPDIVQVLLVQEKTPTVIDDKSMRFLAHFNSTLNDPNSIADLFQSSDRYNSFAYEIIGGVTCAYLSHYTSRFEFTPTKL